ncbi:ead/Ea22-like family protein [Escherichia coli]|nr:ead/Ea22-like family protein [Escherichia coli]
MSKIDYQALREAAEKATWGDWDSYKPHRGARGYEVRLSSQAIAQHVLKNNAEFIAAFNPKVALALLDERERNQQYIKRRDQENEDIALTVGKLRVELEAAENNLIDSECHVAELEEALRDKQALLEASEKRIAELEAELVSQTCKLNELSGNSPVTPDSWISCSERMPEETKMLLAFSQGEIVAAYWNWVVNPIDYKKYRAFTYLSGNILDDVTHWMPLPEPPQEVNRG